jgi:hypothetical protein
MSTSTLLNSLHIRAVSTVGPALQQIGRVEAAHLCCKKKTAIYETRKLEATRKQKQDAITQPPERDVEKPCETVFLQGS